jgi:hypothetical protein
LLRVFVRGSRKVHGRHVVDGERTRTPPIPIFRLI